MSDKKYFEMSEAPKDGTLIWGLYDENEECLIRWNSEQRKCMLAGIGGGNGYFGAGWEDDLNHLIVDVPLKWRPE